MAIAFRCANNMRSTLSKSLKTFKKHFIDQEHISYGV